MSSDDKKTWGTIFLDANRESSLSKLDAMQAASRHEQHQQKSQQDYLERVRQKAIDRAREILGEAYTERQSVLEEAERDGERIRAEARATQSAAEETRSAAQELRHQAQAELDNAVHIRNAAHEEGFQAGLAQAQDELNNFRMAMGSSVAGVLHVIESQCPQIFAHWREQLVDLLKASVKYGTSLALSERHEKVLESMLLEAVRQLDERRSVTLHVNPEDEPVVADLFGAAKEKNPDLGMWKIVADSSLNPGDIIAESLTGTVDSRVESYLEMVDNIVRHLSLPESIAEAEALAQVHATVESEIEQVEALTPTPEPEPTPEELAQQALMEQEAAAQAAAYEAEQAAAFAAHPDEALAQDSSVLPTASPESLQTPQTGSASPEEKAAIQNLFSMDMGDMSDDDLDEAVQSAEKSALDEASYTTQSMNGADDTLSQQQPHEHSGTESINHGMDFSHNVDALDQMNSPHAKQQEEIPMEARAHSSLQELEDELLGANILPPPSPMPPARSDEERFENDGLFGDEHIIRDKV